MNDQSICRTWCDLQKRVLGSLGGWMCETEREELFRIARTMQPGERFMEIGVYGGTTLSVFALMAPGDCEIIGMDSWENETPNNDPDTGEPVDLRTFCMRNLEKNGVADRVRLIDGSSHWHGPTWNVPLDVLIIDGDHTGAGVAQDLRDFVPWVRLGGRLILDDYWSSPEVRVAIDNWFSHEPPTRWRRTWGATDFVRNAEGGLLSKMVIFERIEP